MEEWARGRGIMSSLEEWARGLGTANSTEAWARGRGQATFQVISGLICQKCRYPRGSGQAGLEQSV